MLAANALAARKACGDTPRHSRKSDYRQASRERNRSRARRIAPADRIPPLVEPDEQELRALILVNVIFVATVPEARRRTVNPRNNMLRFVVTLIETPGHVAAKIRQQ